MTPNKHEFEHEVKLDVEARVREALIGTIGRPSAACRSERLSANCITVTKANLHGVMAGRPRTSNSLAKSSSSYMAPSTSRICR